MKGLWLFVMLVALAMAPIADVFYDMSIVDVYYDM